MGKFKLLGRHPSAHITFAPQRPRGASVLLVPSGRSIQYTIEERNLPSIPILEISPFLT